MRRRQEGFTWSGGFKAAIWLLGLPPKAVRLALPLSGFAGARIRRDGRSRPDRCRSLGFPYTGPRMLESEGYRVVGAAGDVGSTIEAGRAVQPEVALVDVYLPDGDGLGVAFGDVDRFAHSLRHVAEGGSARPGGRRARPGPPSPSGPARGSHRARARAAGANGGGSIEPGDRRPTRGERARRREARDSYLRKARSDARR
jgi:hypothetical protein